MTIPTDSGLRTLEPHEPEVDPHHSKRRTTSMFDPKILRRAVGDSFIKLNPRTMARNPVMFVVEVGSVVTTLLAIRDTDGFAALVSIWLWFTVLFANFAEAVAEGRGKAQADTLRKTRSETVANVRLSGHGSVVEVPAEELRKNDMVSALSAPARSFRPMAK